ncbi:MAG: AAA family ATPase [Leptolyngbyaceae cyanobacterium bins.302]|nr:AAA family ATPase [Leptolyngbyaceae cyanobacterium bins.302]
MMKLTGFRVTNFRSVDDSGWIDIGNVTSLIGTNESGKTNLLLPLWKLNPAKDGEINPTADYPRKQYNDIRRAKNKPVFIEARFDLPDYLAEKVSKATGSAAKEVKSAVVKRTFSGEYQVSFPDAMPKRYVSKDEVMQLLSTAHAEISDLTLAGKTEEPFKAEVLAVLYESITEVKEADDNIEENFLKRQKTLLERVNPESPLKRSIIVPRFGQVIDSITEMIASITKPHPKDSTEAKNLVVNNLPAFVYYSNYGNLDSEIYLPHVIDNINRTNLGNREEAKARTLKVLFEFVKLNPQEILELGRDFPSHQGQPTEQQIREITEKKKERDILLQSAGTKLTQSFRDWWKQGEYRFRFQADGDHFRIWVSDDKRPEEIELEGRSTGLQWFLSFYLIFLVESADSHDGAILLLDEPGMTLHPIAQQNLSDFFANLAETNQLIYTTHSPFLVDPDHLDRVKAVYVNNDGTTAVSSNLRAGEKNSAQTKSIYPVHAALGLSVSETLLQGCQAVVVEGTSDQHYLSAVKSYLIGRGMITPKREIIFVPAGGVKGVGAVVSLLTATDEALPHVILDSDMPGHNMAKLLSSNLYKGSDERIILVGNVRSMQNAEIEDLFPTSFLAKILTRLYFRDVEDDLEDVIDEEKPIIPQIQEYAQSNNVILKAGWKVDVAIQSKTRLLRDANPMKKYESLVDIWKQLFEQIQK